MSRDCRHIIPLLITLFACVSLLPPRLCWAEELILKPGTKIRVYDNPATEKDEARLIELDVTHYLLRRATISRANAHTKLARRLEAELKKCTEDMSSKEEGAASWFRWVGVGALIGGAFVMGMAVGR